MEKDLQKLGLGENEARVYMAALGMNSFTAGTIAQRTKIKRPTTYLALSNLIELGLISEIFNGKKKLFQVENIKSLENLANRKRRQAQEAERIVEELIIYLKNNQSINSEDPKVVFYKGFDAMKNVLLEISASSHPWYFFGSSTEVLKKISLEDLKEILEVGEKFRQKSGRPKIYFITDDGMLKLKEFANPDPARREVKILPETIKASSALIISEDKLIILNFITPFAAIVKSKEVVEVIKVMYKMIWESLRQLPH